MAVTDWSATAADNTSIDGTNIAENCPPSGLNDAIRKVMAGVRAFYDTTALVSAPTTVSGVWTFSAQPVFDAVAKFNDNDAATFGTGNDFTVTHNGSNTVLAQVGTGALFIDSANGIFLRSPSGDTQVTVAANGAVTLAHDGSARIATSSAGATVTGTLNATTNLTIDGDDVATEDYVDAAIAAIPGWVYATPQATTSGTEFDFGSLPATVTEIDILFNGVSLSGTDHILVQIGDSGGIETSGYDSNSRETATSSTSGYIAFVGSGARAAIGAMRLVKFDGNTWISTHNVSAGSITSAGAGSKTTSATLDRVRVTRTGTDTFDAGSVTIRYR
jgi:hypothetical protein